MSNLGWYQWFTTNAKKVGGPLKLLSLIAVGGYAVIRTGEAGIKKAYRLAKKHIENKTECRQKSKQEAWPKEKYQRQKKCATKHKAQKIHRYRKEKLYTWSLL